MDAAVASPSPTATSTANQSVNTVGSQSLGEIEVVANIRVRKFKKRKEICAPPVGQPFGMNVQHLPQLGIGVNTVHYTSPLFNSIRRGDILCEFMGKNLRHDTSVMDFVNMLRKEVSDGTERKIVVEYTAADLIKLWERGKQYSNMCLILKWWCYCYLAVLLYLFFMYTIIF